MHASFLTRRSALLGLGARPFQPGAGRRWPWRRPRRRGGSWSSSCCAGALDGMAAVVPYGDPALAGAAGRVDASRRWAADGGMLDLGGFYGPEPGHARHGTPCSSAGRVAAGACGGRALPVSRSHFEAQDYMESGADHRMNSGWLNRAVLAMPKTAAVRSRPLRGRYHHATADARPGGDRGLGHRPASAQPDADLYARIAAMHAARSR